MSGRARLNALAVYEQTGIWGLCAASRPGLDAGGLARRWAYTGEYYADSSVRAIRALSPGFDVIPDSGDVHAIIVLPWEPQRDHVHDPLWSLLQSAFSDTPLPNPSHQARE